MLDELRIDRSAFSVLPLAADSGDGAYWATRSPAERLAAVEFMRQVMYGYDPSTSRLQRILTVARRSSR